uniref:Uncharacterized protein n=1 Tax=Oryza sativa subsp. japonica TaxID=39947 RepID=A0MLT7_ORYSJ|nr:hypothetical protein [Oryza sativa Japonica Group]
MRAFLTLLGGSTERPYLELLVWDLEATRECGLKTSNQTQPWVPLGPEDFTSIDGLYPPTPKVSKRPLNFLPENYRWAIARSFFPSSVACGFSGGGGVDQANSGTDEECP